ncbi:TPA: glycine zipper 2TM domain-containing protein [Vibrio vulnificus]|uniref:glycine zipper 2TM domain-containing protein n=1 Tax=Vibrio vulnificus TaxID=672 RepID=UPI000CD302F1|nr:glycine zipper 2TM domain-containing protein [Vibrio vulnificus]EGQ7957512.1 glycine zipper 2TM domain-containing protein [Vibrio vulnificus]EGQ7987932.1 glycine zipper 2TM domain-containing protein [Vibrio vulnificus]EGQ9239754.1 glycine zipper 2TM domain-containing protein [Vibrio vulnificus]EGR0789796.1 glycine zipper 2TM domain-containing protein [Vibrio vulnificus]EGR0798186.1 glycine zipper 2TM domain-containing protein [Vibrio vulnificus]
MFMKKWLYCLLLMPFLVHANYERNVAKPVNKVIYGEVESVRYISQQEIMRSQAEGWKTLLGATIGGLVGNQFGGGTGKEVATAIGAVAGAVIVQNQGQSEYRIEYQLVELLIETEKGQLINVIQDVDKNMLFNRADKVRMLYFDDGVRVDLAL